MPGYQHPCRYCKEFVPPDARTCPFCGKRNPTDALRCPKCQNPVVFGNKACSHCGLKLEMVCPACFQTTFMGDYCQLCTASLTVVCPNPKCKLEQILYSDNCSKCGKPLHQ